MRRLRRIAAMLTQLLMIQVAIMSSAAACPMANDASAGTTASSAHSAPSHPMQHQSPHHSSSHCELPCTPTGCTSGAHCTSVAAFGASMPSHDALDAGIGATRARTDAPQSVSTAPEPPPPRA